MRKIAVLGLLAFATFAPPRQSFAQKAPSTARKAPGSTTPKSGSAKLEAIFKSAEVPYVKVEDDHYKADVTIDEGETDQVQIFLQTLGDDPHNKSYEVMQIYFYLGEVPEGSKPSPALLKQLNEWNQKLVRGTVFIDDNVITYGSSLWTSTLDEDAFIKDTVLGHYASKALRKEIEPYLKQ